MAEIVFGLEEMNRRAHEDTEALTREYELKRRPICGKCGEARGTGGPDPCLGYLDGVIHACCGHGFPSLAYVVVAPGWPPDASCSDIPDDRQACFYGRFAVEVLAYLTAPDGSR